MDHGMESRMRLRGHFIGALTLAFISVACASANAKSTDGAADEHTHHHAAPLPSNKIAHSPATLIQPAPGAPWIRLEGFATADQLLAELSDLSQLHRPVMT
jgi:hypothetical protein